MKTYRSFLISMLLIGITTLTAIDVSAQKSIASNIKTLPKTPSMYSSTQSTPVTSKATRYVITKSKSFTKRCIGV